MRKPSRLAAESEKRIDTVVAAYQSLRALARYHNASATRVALRANAMVAGMTVFLFGFAPDRWGTVRGIVLGLVSTEKHWQIRTAFAALCLTLASVAERRLGVEVDGWSRSLPFSGQIRRRTAAIAVAQSQTFAIALAVLALFVTVAWYHVSISWAKLAGLALVVVASAVTRVEVSAWRRVTALAALGAAVRGNATFDLASLMFLLLADLGWRKTIPTDRRPRVAMRPFKRVRSVLDSWVGATWAALPMGGIVNAAILPAVFVVFAYLIVRHNVDLPTSLGERTVRVAGALAIMASVASMSNLAMRSAPAWGWARSLPRSSTQRALADAIVLAIPMSGIPIALFPLEPEQAALVACLIPPVACAGASAMRVGRSRQTGAAGESATFAILAGASVVIWPIAAIALFATTPLIVRQAATRDRRLQPAEWVELQYDAEGGPRVLRRS